MELGVRPCARVLLGDVCSELDVLTDGAAERLVVGHTGIVESLRVTSTNRSRCSSVISRLRCTSMMYPKPSSSVNRGGPPNDSAVNQVKWSTWVATGT